MTGDEIAHIIGAVTTLLWVLLAAFVIWLLRQPLAAVGRLATFEAFGVKLALSGGAGYGRSNRARTRESRLARGSPRCRPHLCHHREIPSRSSAGWGRGDAVIPADLVTVMQSRTLLFLGYGLRDGNFRVLLDRLNRHRLQPRFECFGYRRNRVIELDPENETAG